MKNMSTPIFIAAAVLGISLAHPMSVRADAPQHHDQVPGFHRLAVGDLEVTSLYDGGGQFEPRWLNGQKRIMTAVANTVEMPIAGHPSCLPISGFRDSADESKSLLPMFGEAFPQRPTFPPENHLHADD